MDKSKIKESGYDREGRIKWEVQRGETRKVIINVLSIIIICLLAFVACFLIGVTKTPAKVVTSNDVNPLITQVEIAEVQNVGLN